MKPWLTKKEKPLPKEGVDYEFLDMDGLEKISAIRILNGKFKGVIYHYGKVKVIEEEEARLASDGTKKARIKFDYFIDHEGSFKLKDLHNNKKFDKLMGDILVSIFDNNILKKEKEIDDEPFRVINTEKLDL
jgi:hypothetical protein